MGVNITQSADWKFANYNLEMIANETKGFDNEYALDILNDNSLVYKLPAIIFCGTMMVVGLPGNMVVFYVYFFKWRRSTSRIFILFLAALDMFNCATILPMEIFVMKNSLKLNYPFLCKIFRYETYVMNCSSALILVGIALDRFQRICRPYTRPFSEWKSKCTCICAIVFAISVTWPSLVLYGTRTTIIANITTFSCSLLNEYDTTPYPIAYFAWMTSTTAIVFAVLIILYYAVGIQIYKHREFKRKNCTHVEKIIDEKSLTMNSVHTKSKDVRNGNATDTLPHEMNLNIVPVDATNAKDETNDDVDKGTRHHLLPMADTDPETSCAFLEVKTVQNGSAINVTQNDTAKRVLNINASPKRYNSPGGQVKKRTKRIRYMLVRGSSTLTASGRNRCSNCITVRIGRSTLMLFLITIAYVISFLPFYTVVIMRQINPMYFARLPETSKSSYMAYLVFVRSYILSSAINPFIYSFCNTQFRDYCKELFARLILRRQRTSGNSRFHHRH